VELIQAFISYKVRTFYDRPYQQFQKHVIVKGIFFLIQVFI